MPHFETGTVARVLSSRPQSDDLGVRRAFERYYGRGRTLSEVAVRIAREAADLARTVRDQAVTDGVDTKSTETDVVTMGDRAVERLVRERLAACRVTLKLRWADFRTLTRSHTGDKDTPIRGSRAEGIHAGHDHSCHQ